MKVCERPDVAVVPQLKYQLREFELKSPFMEEGLSEGQARPRLDPELLVAEAVADVVVAAEDAVEAEEEEEGTEVVVAAGDFVEVDIVDGALLDVALAWARATFP